MPVTVAAAAKTVIVADDTAFVRDRFKAALQSVGLSGQYGWERS